MRNLQECQAEVFRRSEKRIQQRKRTQKAVLACCLPFVLCVTVLFLLSLQPSRTKDALGPGTGEPVSEHFSGEAVLLQSIQVSGPGVSETYTDPNRVARIKAQLEAYEKPQDEAYDEMQENHIPPEAPGTVGSTEDDKCSTTYYTVVYKAADGKETRYTLTGNLLANQTLGQSCVLSQDRMYVLYQLLGIPSP